MKRLLLITLVAIWSGCAITQQLASTDKPDHHTAEGFKNLHIEDPKKRFFDFLRMRFFTNAIFGDEVWADHPSLGASLPFQQVDMHRILSSAETPQIT